jgi:hypothetical protein
VAEGLNARTLTTSRVGIAALRALCGLGFRGSAGNLPPIPHSVIPRCHHGDVPAVPMLTARLTPEELEAVTARAEREGVTRSELVREALRRLLEETKRPAE